MNKHKQFPIEEKVHIVFRLENEGEIGNVYIALEFGVGHSIISTIWKNRNIIKRELKNYYKLKTKKLVSVVLLKWFKLQ